MPIYEYACEKCEHEFEAEQRITDEPLESCPSCRRGKVKRLISQTSLVLKGGGWYSDLYSSKDPKASNSDDKDKAAKPAAEKKDATSKSGGKTDSKGDGKGGGKSKGKKAAA